MIENKVGVILDQISDVERITGQKFDDEKFIEALKHQWRYREYAGEVCTIDNLPESIIQTINQQIEELDPQAEIRINLTCPECSHRWEVFFDITSFLWTEIDEWAGRMLQTVHKLARACGWTEKDILNLSPIRRQLYLGMVGI